MNKAALQRSLAAIETLAQRFDFVLVPGFKNSGPHHWQSEWEALTPAFKRVTQLRWDERAVDRWVTAISRTLAKCDKPAILIGHSLGAVAACSLPEADHGKVAGLFIVAPPEPSMFHAEDVIPTTRLFAPAVVIASRDDPVMSFSRTRWFAERWGARLVDLGEAGHINCEAGFGVWRGGLELLAEFANGEARQPPRQAVDLADENHGGHR